jgi:hypothetical protein
VSHPAYLQPLSPSTKRLAELMREEGTARYVQTAMCNMPPCYLFDVYLFQQREYVNIAKIPITLSLCIDKISENIKDTQNQKTKKKRKKAPPQFSILRNSRTKITKEVLQKATSSKRK